MARRTGGFTLPSARMMVIIIVGAALSYRLALEWKAWGDFMFKRTSPAGS